jgi:hypothetical protein
LSNFAIVSAYDKRHRDHDAKAQIAPALVDFTVHLQHSCACIKSKGLTLANLPRPARWFSSQEEMRPSATKGRRASPPRQQQGGFFMSDDQDGDEQSAGAVPSPDSGEINIDEEQSPRQRFQPEVIKGGLTPESEISAVDRIRERLIRIGCRPGGPTFPEVMRARLREQFPDMDDETLDSIEKHYF